MYSFENLKKLFLTDKKFTLKEIKKHFKLNDCDVLISDLKTLEEEGFIISLDGYLKLFPKTNYATGKIVGLSNGYGSFYLNNERYTIHKSDLSTALNNDLCLFLIDKVTHQAKVKKIIKRFNDLIVCEFKNNELQVYGNSLGYTLSIKEKDLKSLVEGTRALVKITNENDKLTGNIVEIIGHKDDPDIDLKQIALSKSFDLEFSKDVTTELEKIPNHVIDSEIDERLDLRDKLIYTIDCDNTKDMDDAISIEINEKGNYVLGVHIADVAHYIKPGSALFNEAYKRGTSVYMLDSVIPMIPKYLSNGICSLNPNVDRLTKSCIMEIDQQGNIVDYKIINSVINSKKKMKYSEVNQILEDNINIPSYEPFIDNLKLAKRLNEILNKQNFKRGYIEFLSTDLEFTLNENNKATEFKTPKQRTAEKIIENFMLLANQTVAINYCWMPFLFRIHEIPNEEIIKNVFEILRKLNYKIPFVHNFDNPKVIQGILKNLSKDENFKIISNLILRGMKKAKYSSENLGHFALAFSKYTHFTSPIRRLCDLIVHILIDTYNDKNFEIDKQLDDLEKFLTEASVQASLKERKAEEAEKEANMMKMAEYMEDHIGEYFNGKIVNISSSYIIVETSDNIIGKVLLSNIKGDFYQFNNDSLNLFGKKTKEFLNIGDNVRIKVLNASKEFRTIDFEIVEKINCKPKTLSFKKA